MDEPIQAESLRETCQRVERRAVIEVGTNSVKLLVADLGRALHPVLKRSLSTRLGQGAFRSQSLQPEAIARTVEAIEQFVAEAAAWRPISIRVLATSAAREASNGLELIEAIQRAMGLSAEIISGEQEAGYVFRGVTSDPAIGPQPVLIVDVGGGSTEWVVGEAGLTCFRKSTRLGTARLLELHPPGDPPSPAVLLGLRAAVLEFLQAEVSPSLQPVLQAYRGRALRLVGLGGGLKALARLSSTDPASNGHPGRSLRRAQLTPLVERLWGLCLQDRRQLVGLDPPKAEVILAGAVIHEAVLLHFGFDEMISSGCGLREGSLLIRPGDPSHDFGSSKPWTYCTTSRKVGVLTK